MNVKKFNAIVENIRRDKMIKMRDFHRIVDHLGGEIKNGEGSCKKLYYNGKVITIHCHSNNDFITRDTWKLMGLR